jgi:hypothetical protein
MRVAVVTARYPPMDSTGTIRARILRDHLPAHGIDPVVVTLPEAWVRGEGPLTGPIEEEADVLRPSSSTDGLVRAAMQVPGLRRAQRALLRPDVLALWARAVPRRVAPDLADVDAVFATGPPFSALTAARLLAARLHVPLVVELRDPPGLDRRAQSMGRIGLARVARFTRRTLEAANAVIVVTPRVKQHLVEVVPSLLGGEHVVVVPNSAPTPTPHVEPDAATSGPLVIAYVGSLRASDDWRLVELLADAVAALPDGGAVRLVGSFRVPSTPGIAAHVAAGRIVLVGRVGRDEAVGEMASADASLVFVGDDEQWWIGRKVLESLGVARRILAIAPPGDTSALLHRSSRSTVIDRRAAGPAEITAAVAEIAAARGTPAEGPEPAVPTDEDLARLVAEVIRAAATGQPLPADWHWGQ